MLPPRAFGALLAATCVATLTSAACGVKRDVARDGAGTARSDTGVVAAATPSSAQGAQRPHVSSAAQTGASTPSASTGAMIGGCGRGLLNVMVRRGESGSAVTDSMLRAQASRILKPVRGLVTSVDYSAVIRTFRVHLADTATSPTIDRLIQQLRASHDVDDVSRDECTMHIDRPSTSVPAAPSHPPVSPGARANPTPDR